MNKKEAFDLSMICHIQQVVIENYGVEYFKERHPDEEITKLVERIKKLNTYWEKEIKKTQYQLIKIIGKHPLITILNITPTDKAMEIEEIFWSTKEFIYMKKKEIKRGEKTIQKINSYREKGK